MRADRPLSVVHVVVPARDEAARLPGHLLALRAAVDELLRRRPDLEVRATVVLDSCTDDSDEVLLTHPWVDVARLRSGVVGRVRGHGVERARGLAGGRDADEVWVASTDADTLVPPGWLVEQLALAALACDLVIGTVHPDPAELTPGALARWRERHLLREGHTHVHGANLGFRLSAYDAVGGFGALRTGEDVDLVARMRLAGVAWCATARTQVLTSGRSAGRAPDGFAAYVARLEADLQPGAAGHAHAEAATVPG